MAIDDHDEEQEAKHIKDWGQAFEHLPKEPSNPPAEVGVNHKEHPQRSGDPEVTCAPDHHYNRLDHHHHQSDSLHP